MYQFIVLCYKISSYNGTVIIDVSFRPELVGPAVIGMPVVMLITLFYREMVLIFEMSTERKTEPDEQSGYSMLHVLYDH